MSGFHISRRGRLLAPLTTAALVLAMAPFAATSAGAAEPDGDLPAPSRAALGKGVPSAHVDKGAVGVPASGQYSFLLRLDAQSTGRAFAAGRRNGPSAASAAARSQLSRVRSAQNAVIGDLPARTPVLYRMHAALAAVAVRTDVANYDALTRIPGVASVHPITPKKRDNSYAVPLQGAPAVWEGDPDLGADTRVAVIDTGIDYTHANFGGAGTKAAYDEEHSHADEATLWSGTAFPTAKVVGGYDLVGDTYDADPTADTYQPVPKPDPNPLDCEGHGSHVAGSVAGLGVTEDGDTYAGDYDTSTDFDAMRIGPGMAPQAKLLAIRVFGCVGSTDVTAAAIDRALDPNGDGSTADAVDVVNLSLGSDFGSPEDGDAVAADAASVLGVTMAISAGNSADLYDVSGSPGSSRRAITVAASLDAQSIVDGLDVSYSGGESDQYAAERSVAYDWETKPDLAGEIVIPTTNTTGCSPFSGADAAAIAGHIALLTWTDDDLECGSVARSGNVAAAGGIGFVFASNMEAFSAGITGSAVIPGVLVNKSGGDAIRAAIADAQTATVTGTERNAVTQQFEADNDKMTDFSSRGGRGAGSLKPDVTAVGGTVFSTSVGTGNEGETESGTSMAAPMVAGLSALVVSAHPDWTPEQVKADIMNTAGQDLDTNGSQAEGGDRYGPNRVGTGRIQAGPALANEVLAYSAQDAGVVSVSFGPVEVTGPVSQSKTVTVQNTGDAAATYTTSYDEITSVPGVSYEVSPASVTLAAGESKTVTVTLSIPDAGALTKTVDATHGRAMPDGTPLETLADASGNLLLTSTGEAPQLRVPVYSAPRPASTLTQDDTVVMSGGDGTITLEGDGVDQGEGEESVRSLVTGLSLDGTSPQAPTCSETVTRLCVSGPTDRGADIEYVGTTSDAPFYETPASGQAYFGISTHGAHTTAAGKVEFDIYIDTDEDGAPDVVAYNTRLTDSDVMVTNLVDLETGAVIDTEVTNNRLGDVDSAIFDSDVLLMPVWLNELTAFGVNAESPTVNYAIASYSSSSPGSVDELGWDGDEVDGSLSADLYEPAVLTYGDGFGVSGDAYGANTPFGPLLYSEEGTVLDVHRFHSRPNQKLLLLHFHNQVGDKAQVVSVKAANSVSLSASPTSLVRGGTVSLKVTVTPTGDDPVPTGQVRVVNVATGATVASGNLGSGGTTTLKYKATKPGMLKLQASYAGDGQTNAGTSAPVTVTVKKAAAKVGLAMPGRAKAGTKVKATVSVVTVQGIPATGKVQLRAGKRILGSAKLVRGKAVIRFTPRQVGRLVITAVYPGDATYASGKSPQRTLVVRKR